MASLALSRIPQTAPRRRRRCRSNGHPWGSYSVLALMGRPSAQRGPFQPSRRSSLARASGSSSHSSAPGSRRHSPDRSRLSQDRRFSLHRLWASLTRATSQRLRERSTRCATCSGARFPGSQRIRPPRHRHGTDIPRQVIQTRPSSPRSSRGGLGAIPASTGTERLVPVEVLGVHPERFAARRASSRARAARARRSARRQTRSTPRAYQCRRRRTDPPVAGNRDRASMAAFSRKAARTDRAEIRPMAIWRASLAHHIPVRSIGPESHSGRGMPRPSRGGKNGTPRWSQEGEHPPV